MRYRIILALTFFIFQCGELLAGPGGKIAKELFDSPLGKIVGVFLFIVLSPLIAYLWYKKNKSIRSTKKKMAMLSQINYEVFDEINLKNRMTDIFRRVHKAWSEKDVTDCEAYMTSWYMQNQQSVFLDEWKRKGMMNVCSIQEVNSVNPIHIRITENPDFDGSRIMYAIDANMEDYLVKIDDSSVVEGKKGFKDVETVWTLRLDNNVWKVDNIEQSVAISSYAKMDSELSDNLIYRMYESGSYS